MATSISSVISGMREGGTLPTDRRESSSAVSSPEARAVPAPLAALREQYPSAEDFIMAVTPERQLEVCRDPERCHFGDSPTLGMLNSAYGNGTAEAWLVPEITEACLFCGLREQPDQSQLLKLVRIIVTGYACLKADELLLFFFRFCAGKYLHFYNTFDPSIILRSLVLFLRERDRAHEERERLAHEREMAEWQKTAVTYEEYVRMKKG